jgi:molecular chaperone HscA
VLATRSALAADGDLLAAEERAAIEVLTADTERIARSDDHRAIGAAVKALADGTEAFAAMRMNRGIRAALAGKRVEEV